jgi:SpoVK/Ycf46/Vps4 family AAA+-type ATPase
MRRVLNGFLQAVEEDHSTDSPIIAATNHPELLDDALLRRFDLVLKFDPPTDEQIKAILKASLRPLKFPRPAWKPILSKARGFSQAELARTGDEVVKAAILDERQVTTSDEVIAKLDERHGMRTTFRGNEGSVKR